MPVTTFDLDRQPAESFPVLWPVATRWEDNDHYGHVNNVKYYSYFDTAVNGWLIEVTGTDIRALPAIGVVAETTCRYHRELSFPDQLMVGLSVLRLGNRSITYGLALFRVDEDEQLVRAATGRFVHVYVDVLTRRPIPVPDVIATAAAALVTSPTD